MKIKCVVEIFVCLLKKQTKQQKQTQEHLLVYKYTWFCSDFIAAITAYGMLKKQEHLQELLRLQHPDKSCLCKDPASLVLQRKMHWDLVGTRLLSLLFICFAKSFAGCRVTIETALKAEQWFVENFCLERG